MIDYSRFRPRLQRAHAIFFVQFSFHQDDLYVRSQSSIVDLDYIELHAVWTHRVRLCGRCRFNYAFRSSIERNYFTVRYVCVTVNISTHTYTCKRCYSLWTLRKINFSISLNKWGIFAQRVIGQNHRTGATSALLHCDLLYFLLSFLILLSDERIALWCGRTTCSTDKLWIQAAFSTSR